MREQWTAELRFELGASWRKVGKALQDMTRRTSFKSQKADESERLVEPAEV